MTQEALKMSQEALAGLKDVEKQVRELIAENKALKEALREHAMREVQRLGQEIEQECWCTTCRPITMADMRFVVCPDCGNKRCPKANDHRNACTNSNEVGQEGSSWEHVKPLAQHDSVQAKPEPEQEPAATVESVATVVSESGNQEVTMSWWHEPALPVGTKLYTTPPQRKPLTSMEIRAIEVEVAMSNSFAHPTKAEEFARAIEAAHGIRY